MLLFALLISGCQKVQTPQYYFQHPDERKEILAKCRAESDKGNKVEGKLAENCRNAQAAIRMTINNMVQTAP